ncbi:hypothetical protein Tco_1560826 [Tanacetum coccineum]
MSTLKFAKTQNLVAFLSKPEESDGFKEIFWATTKAKTINRECQIQALIDKKKVIITETSIRSDLKLEDAEVIRLQLGMNLGEAQSGRGDGGGKKTLRQFHMNHPTSIHPAAGDGDGGGTGRGFGRGKEGKEKKGWGKKKDESFVGGKKKGWKSGGGDGEKRGCGKKLASALEKYQISAQLPGVMRASGGGREMEMNEAVTGGAGDVNADLVWEENKLMTMDDEKNARGVEEKERWIDEWEIGWSGGNGNVEHRELDGRGARGKGGRVKITKRGVVNNRERMLNGVEGWMCRVEGNNRDNHEEKKKVRGYKNNWKKERNFYRTWGERDSVVRAYAMGGLATRNGNRIKRRNWGGAWLETGVWSKVRRGVGTRRGKEWWREWEGEQDIVRGTGKGAAWREWAKGEKSGVRAGREGEVLSVEKRVTTGMIGGGGKGCVWGRGIMGLGMEEGGGVDEWYEWGEKEGGGGKRRTGGGEIGGGGERGKMELAGNEGGYEWKK